jgi:hypothetical protein
MSAKLFCFNGLTLDSSNCDLCLVLNSICFLELLQVSFPSIDGHGETMTEKCERLVLIIKCITECARRHSGTVDVL